MMDEDFGFDDTVGKKEIDIDGLLVNDKMTANIAFNEVKQSVDTWTSITTIHRVDKDLSQHE
jgi:hypothetical protein